MKVFGRSKWSTGLCSSCQVANDVMGSIRTVGSFFAKQWNFTRTMGRYASLEYGHYGNPTTEFQEKKISTLQACCSKVVDGSQILSLSKDCWGWIQSRVESRAPLYLKLGYNHEVELSVPPAVCVFCFKPNIVCCTGTDKQRVHQFAATVHNCKPPEVYKGKGIMYVDEVIKKKQGKKSK
ncbi:hypothetical protein IFM89_004652 [Coptis chinensis]|uniref:Large ribosomal subunit protein uL6 alpha-beta domain-containing protein n=1 Tax=Coptis chinensis TaxID=261450 RepID=A0A835I9T9_9MAGN|nr:hypothetical protein IFM89_004652 [Coptis chinensis]